MCVWVLTVCRPATLAETGGIAPLTGASEWAQKALGFTSQDLENLGKKVTVG